MGKDKPIVSTKQRRMMAMNEKLAFLRGNLEVYQRAGLRKCAEAKSLIKQMNDIIYERDRMEREDKADRRSCTAHLLLCIAAADFACEACNRLLSQLQSTYGTIQHGQYEFTQLLAGLAKDFGALVVMIDKVRDDRFSLNFAGMSDEIMDTMTAKCLDEAMEIVKRHHDAGNGNNITFRDNEHYRKLNVSRGKD